MVECNLAKVDVAGSNPVSRSIFFSPPEGPLAQSVEQVTLNHKVGGSTPSRPTILFSLRDMSGVFQDIRIFEEQGRVAELADALDLGSSTARCVGSNPSSCIG